MSKVAFERLEDDDEGIEDEEEGVETEASSSSPLQGWSKRGA